MQNKSFSIILHEKSHNRTILSAVCITRYRYTEIVDNAFLLLPFDAHIKK